MILSNHKELSRPVVEKKIRHFLLSFTWHTSHSALNHSVLDFTFRVHSQIKQFSSNVERSFDISSVLHHHNQWLAKKCGTTFSAYQWQKQNQLRIAHLFPCLAPAGRICFALSLARLTICTCGNWIICLFFFVRNYKIVARWKAFFPTGRIPFTQQIINLTWTEATRGGRTNPWLSACTITITPTDRVVSPHEFW